MTSMVRWALVCGSVPPFLAILIFSGWMATRSDGFLLLGMGSLIPAVILWCAALVLTIVAWRRIGLQKGVAVAAALVIFSVPLAAATIGYASFTYFATRVTIINASDRAIGAVGFQDPSGKRHMVRSVPAGEKITKLFLFKGEGAVTFSLNDGQTTGELINYISGGEGYSVVLTIHSSGDTSVDLSME